MYAVYRVCRSVVVVHSGTGANAITFKWKCVNIQMHMLTPMRMYGVYRAHRVMMFIHTGAGMHTCKWYTHIYVYVWCVPAHRAMLVIDSDAGHVRSFK